MHFLWKFFCRFALLCIFPQSFLKLFFACSLPKSMVVVVMEELCLTPTTSAIQSLPRLEVAIVQSPQGTTVLKLKKLLPPLKNILHLEHQYLLNRRFVVNSDFQPFWNYYQYLFNFFGYTTTTNHNRVSQQVLDRKFSPKYQNFKKAQKFWKFVYIPAKQYDEFFWQKITKFWFRRDLRSYHLKLVGTPCI